MMSRSPTCRETDRETKILELGSSKHVVRVTEQALHVLDLMSASSEKCHRHERSLAKGEKRCGGSGTRRRVPGRHCLQT